MVAPQLSQSMSSIGTDPSTSTLASGGATHGRESDAGDSTTTDDEGAWGGQ